MSLPKATKRNSKTIEGQLWHFKADRYWAPDTCSGSMERATICTRYEDGRTMTGGSRERCQSIIAERIIDGTY